ncbi:hypothetical protein SLS53_005206 [Cytospora paraplurivora]|uniref:Uncharacterized protein n=1 Tax=Cytospora paraplurivora TaxID=2898453 RepID=A0AAN9YER1_9PEZI
MQAPPPPLLLVMLVVALVAEASSAPSHSHAAGDDQAQRGPNHPYRYGTAVVLQPRQTGTAQGQGNLQTFTGALGGIRADAITASGDSERPFAVGGDTFMDFASAEERSCDNQMNSCATMANSGGVDFGVADCDDQAVQGGRGDREYRSGYVGYNGYISDTDIGASISEPGEPEC